MPNPAPEIVCLGNAIVDVLGEADDGFLVRHGLPKGVMRAVDEAEADRIQVALGRVRTVSGGSAANTAAVAAALGVRAAFLGRVRDDAAGRTFAADMAEAGVAFPVPAAADGPATSRCVVVVTPDAERTMSTHLGACQTLPAEVDPALLSGGGTLFLEGYAWTSPALNRACRAALAAARAAGRGVALTLSDPGIAAAHRGEFLGLVRDGLVDLVFANRHEAEALAGIRGDGPVAGMLRRERGTWVVTRSGDGCLVIGSGLVERVAAHPVAAVVDTTGAGDAFAGGFLAGRARGLPDAAAARLAGFCAADVIARVGARPRPGLAGLARSAGLLP